MVVNNLLFVLAFASLLFGCIPSEMTEAELRVWVADPDNGLFQEQTHKGVTVRLGYWPSDLLVAQQIRAKSSVSEVDFAQLRQQYDSFHYYILSFSKGGKEALYGASFGQDKFGETLQNLSFRLPRYVSVHDANGDDIPIVDFQFNRTFGMGSGSGVIIALEPKEGQDLKEISWNIDDVGLDYGSVYFTFSGKDIRRVPRITFTMNLD